MDFVFDSSTFKKNKTVYYELIASPDETNFVGETHVKNVIK